MAQTIRGGAYKSADGRWHDANGKPLSSKQVQEAEQLKREQDQALSQEDANLARQAMVTPPLAGVVPPSESDEESEVTAKRPRKRNS